MMNADRALLVPQNLGAVNILVSFIVRVAFQEDVVTFGRARVQRICVRPSQDGRTRRSCSP